ncbi:AAA family ATPase [Pseudomonas sp. FSL R10-1339]|uniref:ATP-binding protein n=1 Tax=Pseudomonas sp. FSL R10-1339 TaxID=2662196 RepID=UPI001297450C|nr:AAA family ATPase [Pseudomonas sp. FSL R10-1339]MQU54904.1 AAA family ATPase [Pseudomonas sp. FSL R10-1339]
MTRYIERLHVENVRKFEVLDVKFNARFNVLAGPNGCGKTSVLVCLAHCFDVSGVTYSSVSEESEFWVDMQDGPKKIRVGLGKNSVGGGYRKGKFKTSSTPPPSEVNRTVMRSYDKGVDYLSPLFIGASRSIKYKVIDGMSRELPVEEAAKYINLTESSPCMGIGLVIVSNG